MAELPTRLVFNAPLSSIERLLSEAVLVRRTAAAFQVVCDDAAITSTARKYAAEALAQRVVADKIAYPVNDETLSESLQLLGVTRDRASELAGVMVAQRTIRRAGEEIGDDQAARAISARVAADPYLRVNIRPASAPTPDAPAAAPKPIVAESGPPEYSNPVGIGRPPTEAAIRQAKAEHAAAVAEFHAIRAGKTPADARAFAARAHDAYLDGAYR